VVIVCPGGLEHGGGIGRQMGYFLRERRRTGSSLSYRVVDSRGPWFLGASPLHVGFAACFFATAFVKLLAVRCGLSTPCIVHVNITGRGSTVRKIILLTIVRWLKLRYLVHVHDANYAEEYYRRGAFMRAQITTAFRGAAKVLVLGARDEENVSRLLQLPQRQIAVLHNAVPDPLPELAKVPARAEPCHLLFLGHLSARKGVPELLRALASPEVAPRRWRATLAGGGLIDEFRHLAGDLGIADRIDFPGWLDEAQVRLLYSSGDILVLPSHAEGLAMAVLEGLSYGLPIITTPVGAHPEVIEPEVSGIFVPPGDVEALAAALARVIGDKELRKRLSTGARRRFLEDFNVRTYAERLAELHDSLLNSRDPNPIE